MSAFDTILFQGTRSPGQGKEHGEWISVWRQEVQKMADTNEGRI